MKTKFQSIILFSFGFVFLLGLQFYFIRNSYRLEEKELIREAREIASKVVDQMNQLTQLNEEDFVEKYWSNNLEVNKDGTIMDFSNKFCNDYTKLVDEQIENATKETAFKIELINEIYSIVNQETNEELLKNGNTILFYKSSNSTKDGYIVSEGKWNSKSSSNDGKTFQKKSHYLLRSRSLFELKNLDALILVKILPLSLVSALILITLLILFYKNLKSIEKQNQQIAQLHTTIDSIAHEINTPITTIKFYLATNPVDSPDRILNRQIGKIEKIVASIHQQEISDKLATIDDFELLIRELQQNNPTVQLQTSCNWNINHTLKTSDLILVVENLVNNACKYKSTKVNIDMQIDNKIEIKIADNGIGIPASERSLIFDKYYRVLRQENNEISGLGVGLFLVKQRIDSYNGTIKVENNHPGGTIFTIYISNEH